MNFAGLPVTGDVIAVAILVVLGPLILSYLNNRSLVASRKANAADAAAAVLAASETRQRERQEDWDRQDEVALRVATAATQAADAAKLLLDSNDKTQAAAEEVARLAAKSAKTTDEKLNVIHGLVNSSLTTSMNGELAATRRELLLGQALLDLVAPAKRGAIKKAIEVAESTILTLQTDIADRDVAAASVAAEAQSAGLSPADGPPETTKEPKKPAPKVGKGK